MPRRRVAVTGVGAVSALGHSSTELWEACASGRNGIRLLQDVVPAGVLIRVGAQVQDNGWIKGLDATLASSVCRTTAMSIVAAGEALTQAGLIDRERGRRQRIGVYLGSGAGPCEAQAESYDAYFHRGVRGIRPTTIPRTMFNAAASMISIDFGLTGGNHTIAAACASSTAAIGEAYQAVAYGLEDVMLTGGYDTMFETRTLVAWNNLRVVSTAVDPSRACCPFDKDRSGLVLGEGAGEHGHDIR